MGGLQIYFFILTHIYAWDFQTSIQSLLAHIKQQAAAEFCERLKIIIQNALYNTKKANDIDAHSTHLNRENKSIKSR